MIEVSTVAPDEQQMALAIFLGHLDPNEKRLRINATIDDAALGDLDLGGLLLARLDRSPVGAGLFVSQPDGTMLVWPPVVGSDVDSESQRLVEDSILQFMLAEMEHKQSSIAQCVLETDSAESADPLRRNGFQFLSQLVVMQRWLQDVPLPARQSTSLGTRSYDESHNHSEFVSVLESTYIGSLDCPSLYNVRSADRAIRSHRHVGVFRPENWTLYDDNAVDAGVLLLNEQPAQRAWEVVYVGVVPAYRGRGFGRQMLVDAMHRAKSANQQAIILTLDAANSVARRIYDGLGFTELGVRFAYVYFPSS
jgi:ribosomal protein S18 acetylase RimI-like enzyme